MTSQPDSPEAARARVTDETKRLVASIAKQHFSLGSWWRSKSLEVIAQEIAQHTATACARAVANYRGNRRLSQSCVSPLQEAFEVIDYIPGNDDFSAAEQVLAERIAYEIREACRPLVEALGNAQDALCSDSEKERETAWQEIATVLRDHAERTARQEGEKK